jgi:hypothetical protein
MRGSRWIIGLVALGCIVASGCYYKKPELREWYAEIVPDMHRQDVVNILGKPTVEYKNELMYVYDDPEDPARFRFVLNDDGIVIKKYFETKADLAEKARQASSGQPTPPPIAGEEPNRSYPGGPLPGFEGKQYGSSPYQR